MKKIVIEIDPDILIGIGVAALMVGFGILLGGAGIATVILAGCS